MQSRLFSPLLASLLLAPGAFAAQQAVSVSFKGYEDTQTITAHGGIAGVVPAGNWNEIGYNEPNGSAAGLIDMDGSTTGMSVTWASVRTRRWAGTFGSPGAEFALLNGFLEGDSGGSASFALSGIPADLQTQGYDLYVYMGAPSGAVGNTTPTTWFGEVSEGTTALYYHGLDLATWDGAYVRATATTPTAPPDANYVVFENLSSASVTVTAAKPASLSGPSSISGFQLVSGTADPLPTTGISINFRGNAPGSTVVGTAGAIPLANWNNVDGGEALTPLDLVDEAGTDSGADLTFTSNSGGYNLGNSGTSADAQLFVGQIIEQSNGNVHISVSDIPYIKYDVYLYYGHGAGHFDKSMSLSDGTTTYIGRNQNIATYTDPIAFTRVSSTTAPGNAGNTVVFEDLEAASFVVTQSYVTGSSGVAGLQIVQTFVDSDGDGLDDAWEIRYFGNLDQDEHGNPDNDGSLNGEEHQVGTDPTNADSDDDGSLDGDEATRGTNPLDPDSDDDGLLDGVETNTGTYTNPSDTGSDPLAANTDGDRVRDGGEVQRGHDPTDAGDTPDLPNVLLILADDLGWGELGSYGQTRILTPVLDQLAADGMRFTDFYAPSAVCAPTRCQLLTGKHSGQAYVRNNYETGGYQLPLPVDTFTLGHLMRSAGYSTGCIGKWGLGGPATTGAPWNQGFDFFFGYLGQVQAHWYYPEYLWRNATKAYYKPDDAAAAGTVVDIPGANNNGDNGKTNNGNVHSHDAMTAEAMQWIADHADEAFFMYLAYPVPHVSVQPPGHLDDLTDADGIVFDNTVRSSVEEFYPGQPFGTPISHAGSGHYTGTPDKRHEYAAMITAMDRDIGRILDLLDTLELSEDTLVVFTSDNGTTYLGEVDYPYFNSLGGLRGYKGNLYEGGIREPLIARWPNRIPAGTTSSLPGLMDDLMPTFSELVDQDHPADVTGRSLLPTLLGRDGEQVGRDHFYWEFKSGSTWTRALRQGDWKLHRKYNTGTGVVTYELYNLATDLDESENVAASETARVEALQRLMDDAHAPSMVSNFHRGGDELPVHSGVTISRGTYGLRLAGTGHALIPLFVDVPDPLEFKVTIDPVSGVNTMGTFLFGDGTILADLVAVTVDGDAGYYRLVHGSDSAQVAMAPGETPTRRFDLQIGWDPASSHVSLLDEVSGISLTLGLTAPPVKLTHYGYQVDNTTTDFAPALPCLPLPPSPTLTDPRRENSRYRFDYERRSGEPSDTCEMSADMHTWQPFLPLRHQARTRFGAIDDVSVQVLPGDIEHASFRIQTTEP